MRKLVEFILKTVIITAITMTCASHVLSNLQIQHVDAHSGKIVDVYNIVECYSVLDYKK